jgi:hypothetical protein
MNYLTLSLPIVFMALTIYTARVFFRGAREDDRTILEAFRELERRK